MDTRNLYIFEGPKSAHPGNGCQPGNKAKSTWNR